MKVLVTDAHFRHALAAIRNLGKRGIDVVAASERRLAQGFFSRYASESVVYPSPLDAGAFLSSLIDVVRSRSVDVVLPVGDVVTSVLSRHADELRREVAIAVPDPDVLAVAEDKERVTSFARANGVPVPRVYEPHELVERFPVVVKARKGSGNVRYANSPSELANARGPGQTVQEWIDGEAFGFFALFDHGRECALFMHRRIREFPVTGGMSTVAESVFDPALREVGLRLLRALRWHGVAMAEFKKDTRDGQYKLIEVNPKFWGSLDLAIAAGVEFPWLTTKVALGEPFAPVYEYEVGVRFRWVFDDLMHALARPRALKSFVADFSDRSIRHDLCREDLKPALVDGAATVASIAVKVANGTLRHPYGVPVSGRGSLEW